MKFRKKVILGDRKVNLLRKHDGIARHWYVAVCSLRFVIMSFKGNQSIHLGEFFF